MLKFFAFPILSDKTHSRVSKSKNPAPKTDNGIHKKDLLVKKPISKTMNDIIIAVLILIFI